MKKKIFKYKIPRVNIGRIQLILPMGTKLQNVVEQCNEPMLYALVPYSEKDMLQAKAYYIRVYETGQELAEGNHVFLGTCLLDGGHYVQHFYQEVEDGE